MKTQVGIALAAALLLAGVSAASAADTMSKSPSSSATIGKASDSLSLSSSQQKTAWSDISAQATKQKQPSGFSPSVGAVLPSTLTTQPVPSKAASDVPALKPYNYAMLDKQLLIVNPSDKKIVEVITQ